MDARLSAAGLRRLLAPALLCLPAAVAAQSAGAGPRAVGYVQARESYASGAGLVGTINRARAGVAGDLPRGFLYQVTAELASPGAATATLVVGLKDAYVGWHLAGFSIAAGQFKTPFSAQYLTSMADVETADRAAVVDALAPKRDIGITGAYAWRKHAAVWLGVFNGEGLNVGANGDSTVLVVGRVALRPLQGVALAADVARYRDSTRYALEASVAYRGIGLKGEYLRQHRLAIGRDDWGYYLLATYWLLPDLQLVAEQEDFRRPAVPGFVRNTAFLGGANLYAAGGRVRLLVNYVSRKVGTRRGTLITQIQVKL